MRRAHTRGPVDFSPNQTLDSGGPVNSPQNYSKETTPTIQLLPTAPHSAHLFCAPRARLCWFLAVCSSPGAGSAQATAAMEQNSSRLNWTCDPKERTSAQIPCSLPGLLLHTRRWRSAWNRAERPSFPSRHYRRLPAGASRQRCRRAWGAQCASRSPSQRSRGRLQAGTSALRGRSGTETQS